MKSARSVGRERRRVQDLSISGVRQHPRRATADIARWLLQGVVAATKADEGLVWLSPGHLSDAPLATVPDRLAVERIRAGRLTARQLLANSVPPAKFGQRAGILVGSRHEPLGVFVLTRRRPEPFTPVEHQLLARLSPLLEPTVSGVAAAERDGDAARTADAPGRALHLLSTLAHEMRTPLTAIKGYATALLTGTKKWTDLNVREALQIIDREASVLTTLIMELLEGAAIERGRLTLRPEPVLLNRLLERLAAEFASQTARHRFVVVFPPRWPVIEADPLRLSQVFRNLLDNAVKYSPMGGLITVTGTGRRTEVEVSVTDQGVGIAPEDLNRLFERFFRAKRSVHVAGSGLGLPIARAIVEHHGGRIWAESTVGQGTTLHVVLPRRLKKGGPR